MVDMQIKLKLNKTINQSINEGKKKKQKSVFTPAKGSVKTKEEKIKK